MFCAGKIPAFGFANALKFGQTVLQMEWKEMRVLDSLKQLTTSLSLTKLTKLWPVFFADLRGGCNYEEGN